MRSRALALALSLLTAAAALVALPSATAPAGAAVQPCTQTFTRGGGVIRPGPDPGKDHSLSAFDIAVEDTRWVTDVNISWDISHPDATQVTLHVLGPKTQPNLAPSIQTYNAGMASGTLNGRYAFDDEAGTTKVAGLTPPAGTYLPATAATGLEQHPANGTWSLWVLNQATYAAALRSFTVTLTYATCDSDGDGVEERSDNCPAVANDQANRDDDTLGDACDLDADGDAIANADDGCPLVGATTRTGCPGVGRTASLARTKKGKRLSLAVGSTAPACQFEAKATLWRKKPGRDIKLVVATTSSRGRYSLRAPRRSGRYYATVARSYVPGEAECGAARSRALRVSTRAELRLFGRSATTATATADTDGDGLDDALDGCPTVASSNSTGCPTVRRTARLRWLAGTRVLQARVLSTADACSSRSRIKLWRVARGSDVRLQVETASFAGLKRFRVSRGARYYVTVSTSYAPGIAECTEATSPKVLVPRPG